MGKSIKFKEQELTDVELRKYALEKAIEWMDRVGRPVTLKLPLKLANVFFIYMTTGNLMDWNPWDDQ